jgi:hypothetical protein
MWEGASPVPVRSAASGASAPPPRARRTARRSTCDSLSQRRCTAAPGSSMPTPPRTLRHGTWSGKSPCAARSVLEGGKAANRIQDSRPLGRAAECADTLSVRGIINLRLRPVPRAHDELPRREGAQLRHWPVGGNGAALGARRPPRRAEHDALQPHQVRRRGRALCRRRSARAPTVCIYI